MGFFFMLPDRKIEKIVPILRGQPTMEHRRQRSFSLDDKTNHSTHFEYENNSFNLITGSTPLSPESLLALVNRRNDADD